MVPWAERETKEEEREMDGSRVVVCSMGAYEEDDLELSSCHRQ